MAIITTIIHRFDEFSLKFHGDMDDSPMDLVVVHAVPTGCTER
jgi:hypothetical protein